MSVVTTVDELEAIYGLPGEASTVKVADRITPTYRVLIEKLRSRRWRRRAWRVSIARRAPISGIPTSGSTRRRCQCRDKSLPR
jgi:hypothetical protein